MEAAYFLVVFFLGADFFLAGAFLAAVFFLGADFLAVCRGNQDQGVYRVVSVFCMG